MATKKKTTTEIIPVELVSMTPDEIAAVRQAEKESHRRQVNYEVRKRYQKKSRKILTADIPIELYEEMVNHFPEGAANSSMIRHCIEYTLEHEKD